MHHNENEIQSTPVDNNSQTVFVIVQGVEVVGIDGAQFLMTDNFVRDKFQIKGAAYLSALLDTELP